MSNWVETAKARYIHEFSEIEKRRDLSDEQKINQLIHIGSATCAAMAIQPIPFADIFVLTPLQAWLGSRIAAVRGCPVSEAEAGDILKEIAACVGLGLLAQQLALGAYKTFLPFLAGFTTIPLVYGLTFAMGRVMDFYFVKKARGEKLSEAEIRAVWASARQQGEQAGKQHANEIKRRADG